MTKSIYMPLVVLFALIFNTQIFAQGVGINTTGAAPDTSAMLHVDAGTSIAKGLLVTGTFSVTGTVPDLGTGSRLMFFPAKAAFRAGYANGTQWNNSSVGQYSVAMGNGTSAAGVNATAFGNGTTANGPNAVAIGFNANAGGNTAVSLGYVTNATGSNAVALGYFCVAGGNSSTAIGNNSTANGTSSTAIGTNTVAGGISSTAIGYSTSATGANSTAMGNYVSTNLKNGAFIIGDGAGTVSTSSAINEMTMGFAGGYRLFSGSGIGAGVFLAPGGNAWQSMSDVRHKENFEPLNGEEVLEKMSKINFTSWNYKQQDPKIYRHYGIMAQDFYKAFGHDSFGTVGNDTTVNPIDMIGIDMSAIQALEKRTADLQNENETLKASVAELQKKFTEQQILIESLITRQKKQIKKRAF